MLLVPMAAGMAVDTAQTLKALSLGLCETNSLVVWLMRRLGSPARGIVAFQAIVLLVFAGGTLLFPSQWALPLVLIVFLIPTIALNRRMIRQALNRGVPCQPLLSGQQGTDRAKPRGDRG